MPTDDKLSKQRDPCKPKQETRREYQLRYKMTHPDRVGKLTADYWKRRADLAGIKYDGKEGDAE